MPEKPYLDIIHRGEWCRRHIRKQLKRHRGRIIRDAYPISAQRCQVCEAKEGLELAVFAELDIDGGYCAIGCDGRIEGCDDLGGEGGASDGTDGVGGVVGKVVFVIVG